MVWQLVWPGSSPIHRSPGGGGVSQQLRDFLELQADCMCVHVYLVCVLGVGLGLWEEQEHRLLAWGF